MNDAKINPNIAFWSTDDVMNINIENYPELIYQITDILAYDIDVWNTFLSIGK
jgi:hypothetical protein